jgi:DNA repair protein RecN (Recombination protein N)
MLMQLSIRNFAVVEQATVSFQKGFNVITGETGAGKSIIVDALGMIIGGRASADYVRYGTDKAELEALFETDEAHPIQKILREYGIETSEDGLVLIRRELSSSGKSVARINGQMVNVSMLKSIGDNLVNIHGQHEHQSLLHPDRHIDWLDSFAGDQWGTIRSEVSSLYAEYQQIKKQVSEWSTNEQDWYRKKDLYQYQLDEIKGALLRPEEDQALQEEQKKLSNAEKIASSITEAYQALFGDRRALDSVNQAIQRLEPIKQYDDTVRNLVDTLQSAFYQVEDVAEQLRDLEDQSLLDPNRLQQVGQRLDQLQLLKRKYGSTLQDVISYGDSIEKELETMVNKDDVLQDLQKRLAALEKALAEKVQHLTQLRMQAGEELSHKIETELKHLHMEKAKFNVAITQNKDENGLLLPDGNKVKVSTYGVDHVEFYISANPGEPPKPLAKIASGGELSRVMLAMKTILADADHVETLIFDEVDTGVSGRAAQSIAEKLVGLAQRYQVFSITHLPQVACMADAHYRIEKQLDDSSAKTRVLSLDKSERIQELARMLGGVEVTSVTEQHADEMLSLANEKREEIQSRQKLA